MASYTVHVDGFPFDSVNFVSPVITVLDVKTIRTYHTNYGFYFHGNEILTTMFSWRAFPNFLLRCIVPTFGWKIENFSSELN